ncbi:hypothetical protein VTN00DRAFT_6315 [Thermoascus crustaceus]|uniref:uncharacterized protein n=1 Tax=Thermoascus crustaceus TaxID=5088 RepID=UPI0037429B86
MATDQPLEVHENVQKAQATLSTFANTIACTMKNEADVSVKEPAKYQIGDMLWLRTAVCNMPVTVANRYLDSSGEWKYQVEDSNGELYSNGEYLTEGLLKR